MVSFRGCSVSVAGLGLPLAFAGAALVGWACADTGQECPIGYINCACTLGGTCDFDLVCVDGTCVDISPGSGDDGPGSGGPGMTAGDDADDDGPSDADASADGTAGTTTTAPWTTDGTGGGPILDVGNGDTDIVPRSGCTAIDLLFVLDGSGSMVEERNALAATNAFNQIILTLEGINGGGVDYRIGVTDDDDHGFLTPPGWFEPDPWFDSDGMTPMEIAQAFNGAVGQVNTLGGAPVGCEHVLSSGTYLLAGDASGFVRPEALLVLVLLTDVDDYGAYDQQGGNTCGLGCTTPPPPLESLLDTLLLVKDDQMDGIAAIVVAGDPSVNDGVNFCGQPGSCGCDGLDCGIFHADRLYAFADMLGANGVASDLCAGPSSVPDAVESALTESIDLACMMFEPEG
jgi:hypothetical protein